MYTTCMLGAYGGQKRAPDLLEPSCGHQGSNVCPLQEQIVLTAELKLSPWVEGF